MLPGLKTSLIVACLAFAFAAFVPTTSAACVADQCASYDPATGCADVTAHTPPPFVQPTPIHQCGPVTVVHSGNCWTVTVRLPPPFVQPVPQTLCPK